MVIERQKSIAEQVEQRLREKISSAEYPPGGRLPSESELAAQFGVSRATVRTALTALEAARLIVRRQGDGTYINKQIMEVDTCLGEEWDFQYMIKASGRVCRITPVSVELRSAADEEAAALEIEPGEQVLAVLRHFYADEQPVIASSNLIPARLVTHPGPYDVSQPNREILHQYSGQEIAYSISDISASLPPAEVVAWLNLAAEKPVLKFTDVFFNSRNRPIVFGINYYNDKALRLRVTRAW